MTEQQGSTTRAWVVYSALRLAFFLAPLAVVYGFSRNLLLSAVVGAVIGLALSVVLLDRQRGAVAGLLQRRADRRRPATDEAIEDRTLDGQSTSAAPRTKP